MGMMIHRNKKKQAEKMAALSKSAENPENYVENVPEEQRYTRTEIARMSVGELRELATNTGAGSAENMTGAELKRYLIDVFGL